MMVQSSPPLPPLKWPRERVDGRPRTTDSLLLESFLNAQTPGDMGARLAEF